MEKPIDDQIVITGIAIVYHTKLQISPGHARGRVGPPLTIQAKDIPNALKKQILSIAHEHAGRYWKRSLRGSGVQRREALTTDRSPDKSKGGCDERK